MIIEIKLNDNLYHITDDSLQFTARRKHTTDKGAEADDILGHCSSLGSAVKKIIRSETGNTKETISLQEYADRVDFIIKDVTSQLTERPSKFNNTSASTEKIPVPKKEESQSDFEF